MNRVEYIYLPILTFIIAGGLVFLSGKAYQKIDLGSVGCPSAYPNHSLTPGKADTSDFGALTADYNGETYSQNHRNVPESVKKEVLKEYGVTNAGEIDHFISLGLGGSNDIANLFAEPSHVNCEGYDLGFRTKDKIETYLIGQMKKGVISPIDAQQCLVKDWVVCFRKYLGNPPKANTLGNSAENDSPVE